MAKVAYDLLIIMLRLHLPWTGGKRIPDQRINEFFDLALTKDYRVSIHESQEGGSRNHSEN